MAARWGGVVSSFLRLIRRPRPHTIYLGGIGSREAVGGVSLVRSVNPEATLEEKVAFLLRRDQEAQQAVNELRQQLKEHSERTEKNFEAAHAHMEEHVTAALETAHAAYLPLRIMGVCALMLGLGLATAGNFVD
jgi:hypothetical protein